MTVQNTEDDTKTLLSKVLDDNTKAAEILAKTVHSEISIEDIPDKLPSDIDSSSFDINDIGIWIDPIDATSQYIQGGIESVEENSPPTKGLKVVKTCFIRFFHELIAY